LDTEVEAGALSVLNGMPSAGERVPVRTPLGEEDHAALVDELRHLAPAAREQHYSYCWLLARHIDSRSCATRSPGSGARCRPAPGSRTTTTFWAGMQGDNRGALDACFAGGWA